MPSRQDERQHLRTVLAERVSGLELEPLQRLQRYLGTIEQSAHVEGSLLDTSDECATCEGTGLADPSEENADEDSEECPACDGTGERSLARGLS